MLDEIVKDSVTAVSASNQPMFDAKINYEQLVEKRNEIIVRWQTMNPQERAKYGANLTKFEESEGNPLRYNKGNLPGSHGMAYLPDTIQAQFGGDTARGTFSDLVTSFPTQIVKSKNLEINLDCTESLMQFYETRFSVSPGTLLSLIPEMSEYYKLTTGSNSRCFPLEIVSANDPRSLKWEFQVGDGETKPRPESIENAFSGFVTSERHGKIIVSVSASEAHKLKACIYTDLYGKFWYIDNPFFPVILPEVGVHFLISNIFSSIMRYRPDEWGNVLTNDVSSGVSLLTRHYFSTLQRKFFIVVLRSISRYIPYVSQTS